MMVNALVANCELALICDRSSHQWKLGSFNFTFDELLSEESVNADHSKPYPFYLAYALEEDLKLGDPDEWQAEWKWDGITRDKSSNEMMNLFVWSRGEELMTEKFPEYHILKELLPDGTVIDGEIIAV